MIKSALVIISSLFFVLVSAANAEVKTPPASSTSKAPAKASAKSAKPVKKSNVASKPQRHATKSVASASSKKKVVKKTTTSSNKRRVNYQRSLRSQAVVAPILSVGDLAGLNLTQDPLALRSSVAYVIDQATSQVLFEKNANIALPIASVTKLMTALVVVEARQDMDEVLTVTDEDVDREKFSSSRLRVGAQLSRDDMLHIALMSSENRAASALGRHFPGGMTAFVTAMNFRAKSLGMKDTHYADPTGLMKTNVASAHDLAKLVVAAYQYPIIRQYSTDAKYIVEPSGHAVQYASSNRLVSNKDWDIGLQKTGYINEAGHCLVMQTRIDGRPVVMIFLDSKGKTSHVADAARMRQWISAHATENLTRIKTRAEQG